MPNESSKAKERCDLELTVMKWGTIYVTHQWHPFQTVHVIPVYNEGQSIGEVISQVCSVNFGGIQKEIIIST